MKILLLPGVNPATTEWLHSVVDKLGLQAASPQIFTYSFWTDKDIKPHFDTEIARLPDQHYDLIVAKSFGTCILMQALSSQKLQCNKALLFGIPLKVLPQINFQTNALQILKERHIFIIQQQNDKMGSVEELAKLSPAHMLAITGNDHQYKDYDLFIRQTTHWLSDTL
jgi:hypothetical protein